MDPADLVDVETDAGLVRASAWAEPGGARWVLLRGPLTALYRFPAGDDDRELRASVVRACLGVRMEVLRVSGPGVGLRRG